MPRGSKKHGRCGTPGCTLPDFHNGPCTTDAPVGKRPRPANLEEPNKFRKIAKASGAEKPRPRPPKPEKNAILDATPPPAQGLLSSGLHRFYHAHRWGVALPPGPVADDCDSDNELDESWRLSETEERVRARGVATPAEIDFMLLWNCHVQRHSAPLVSDCGVPRACRSFARAHAEQLRSAPLRAPLLAHLQTLAAHRLLGREDVAHILLIVDGGGGGGGKSPPKGGGKSPKRSQPAGAGTAAGVAPAPARAGSVETCDRCVRPRHQAGCASRA